MQITIECDAHVFEWLLRYILKMEEFHTQKLQDECLSNFNLNINIENQGFHINPTMNIIKQFEREQESFDAVIKMLKVAD